MPRRSSIEQTPGAEVLVRDRMRDGATVDEITDTLAAALPEAGISRSAVGRYTQAQRALLAAAERTDLLCDVIERALPRRADESGQRAMVRAEAMRTVIFDRQIEGGADLSPREVQELERARKLVEETFALERRNAGVGEAPAGTEAAERQPLSRDAEAAIRAQMEGAASATPPG